MCLELLPNKTESQIAKEDIICYKALTHIPTVNMSTIKDGDEFTGVIHTIECSGKISIESDQIFFCTNHSKLQGSDSQNKHGLMYSWVFDNTVTSIIINNKEIIDLKIATPYRNFLVEIGETYDSELIKSNDDYIHEGLHSFKNSNDAKIYNSGIYVECIIPKGSKYYEGKFNINDAYASDKLTYVKTIGDCSYNKI